MAQPPWKTVPQNVKLDINPKEMEAMSKLIFLTKTCTQMLTAKFFIATIKLWQSKYPSIFGNKKE